MTRLGDRETSDVGGFEYARREPPIALVEVLPNADE